jgi:hypothetical protein
MKVEYLYTVYVQMPKQTFLEGKESYLIFIAYNHFLLKMMKKELVPRHTTRGYERNPKVVKILKFFAV